jgi:hypothetical protein
MACRKMKNLFWGFFSKYGNAVWHNTQNTSAEWVRPKRIARALSPPPSRLSLLQMAHSDATEEQCAAAMVFCVPKTCTTLALGPSDERWLASKVRPRTQVHPWGRHTIQYYDHY